MLIYTFYSNLNPSTSIWSFKRRTRETVWWIITMIIISYWKSKKISIIACYGGVSYFFVEWLHHIIIDWSTNFDHYFLFFLHPMILYVLIFSNDHRKKKTFFFYSMVINFLNIFVWIHIIPLHVLNPIHLNINIVVGQRYFS